MHKVNSSNEARYRIVKCQDSSCNICTRTAYGKDMPPSPVTQGIVVYTCSDPSCSLCDGDYSLLLDIVSPALSPTEEFFPLENDESGDHDVSQCDVSDDDVSNDVSDDEMNFEEMFPTLYYERQQRENTTRTMKRKLSGHLGYAADSRRHSTGVTKILFSDDVDNVDDNQLMSLAMELELDKVESLPDLHKDVITELTV